MASAEYSEESRDALTRLYAHPREDILVSSMRTRLFPNAKSYAVLLFSAALFACCVTASFAQNTTKTVPPVIDVHVHAMDGSPNASPMCPNTAAFTASDPRGKEAPFGWVQEECSPKLYPSANGEYMKDVIAEMERLNVNSRRFRRP